jgi:membrane-bound lytic murein transglycosylase A
MRRYALFAIFFLTACVGPSTISVEKEKPLVLKQDNFSSLPGWGRDNFRGFDVAFSRSCEAISKKKDGYLKQDPRWGSVEKWKQLCVRFSTLSPDSYKSFFETNFVPYKIFAGDEPQGLFTGYYEASLKGARTKHGPYQTPLRMRPDDLVMVDLGEFREELKGQRIAGRVNAGRLKPYEDRAAIEAGKLPKEQDVPLVWVDDPVDAFFVQVQGSGVVEMDDGSVMRIGYAGQNGHIYTAIGKTLIDRGALTKETVSLQTIRAWLEAHPQEAADIMNSNRSYVFFKELSGDGPIGGQGVALTPLRSLAVDYSLLPYGVPLWLDAAYPKEGYQNMQRMMVAQDTGGAIRGPVRGDVFWGYGALAEENAGVMKSQGQYWVLLPK